MTGENEYEEQRKGKIKGENEGCDEGKADG